MTSSTPVDLPEFDAEDPVWADLLWSAARRHDQSIVVLAEYCRRRAAEPVLRWLEDGPGAYRWLAGRLLVEGVPADEGHTAAFVASLGHSLREDLRTTHLAAADFLDLATRTRIPAVRETLDAAVQGAAWDWSWSLGPAIATALAVHDPETVTRIAREMLADPGTKGSARISAASVLAKADERHVAAAVDTIRAVANADHHSHRWHAVEVLVDLAPRLTDDLVGQVAEMLRDVLRTGALPPTQAGVGRLLARLGPRYTTEAVRLLWYLPPGEDDGPEGEGRAEAARGLLEVDPPHTDNAITLLRKVLADHYPLDILHAATTLSGLGPEYEDEAADAVRAVARATRHASIRVAAARTLAALGRRHSAEAAGILRAVLADTAQSDAGQDPASLATTPRPDTDAAAELAALGPPYTAEAAGILRTMIPGPAHLVDAYRNISAARALANIGPQHLGEATGALRLLLAGSALDAHPRVRVVQALAELDKRHDDDITAALHTVAIDPGTTKPFPLTHHLRALARDHPRHTADVADTLGAVLLGAVTRQTPTERGGILGAVGKLTELSAGHPAAVDVLRAVINDPADVSERIGAAVMLAQLDPATIREAIELLVSLITDPGAERRDGGNALGKLKSLGRDHRDRVVDAMRQLLVSPRMDACTRIRAVLELAELDQWYDDDVTAALRAVAADPSTDEPSLTMSWLKDVARKRPRHTTDAAAAVLAVTTRTATDPHIRVDGARLLFQLDSRHTSDAIDILRAVLADPAATPWPAIKAASALAALGPEYAAEALRALHAVAANPEVAQRDRYVATRTIKELESSSGR